MKIQNLKINQFGKLQDKEIQLKEHINIIYGKNESGKSTLLKFILGMFCLIVFVLVNFVLFLLVLLLVA